ncbi:MAG: hypothetical protein CIT03_07525 [Methanobacterium sp.]|nr:MAG: hypothetical protein CIT03_07525 [Methanobacterium sp.]
MQSDTDIAPVNENSNIITTITNEEGYFLFENISPEVHVVWINQDEIPENYRDDSKPAKLSLILQPNSSSEISIADLNFKAYFHEDKIEGNIIDTTSGKGIPGITVYDPPQIVILSIGGGSAILKQEVPVAHQLLDEHPELTFLLRDNDQISQMQEEELKNFLQLGDIIVLRVNSNAEANLISKIIKENPELFINKTIYGGGGIPLIHEISNIAGTKVFEGFTLEEIHTIYTRIFQATNPLTEISKIKTEYPSNHPIMNWLTMREYDHAGGSYNFYNAFLYLLNKHTGSNNYDYKNALMTPNNFIYRDGKIFLNFAEYESYIDPEKQTIGIFGRTTTLYQAGETWMVDEIVKKIDAAGFNVLPVMGGWAAPSLTAIKNHFFDANGNSRIDVLISLESMIIGGRYTASSFEVVNLFEKLNVPILLGMTTTAMTPEEWMISEIGLPINEVHYRIAMPEFQGVAEPILLAAQKNAFDEVTGALLTGYVLIPDRVDKIVQRAANWAKLRELLNSEKKIAIIYYNHSPGKGNIGASYLAVPATIVNILERMEQEGYNVGEYPKNADELLEIMFRQGINVASWAPGVLEEIANNAILWDADEYQVWFNNLNPIAQKQTIEGPVGYIEEMTKLAVQAGEKKQIMIRIDKWKADMVSTINEVVQENQKAENLIFLVNKMVDALKATVNGNNSAWNDFYLAKDEFRSYEISALTGWGEAPGKSMTVTRDGKEYIVIPGAFFGNIFVCPEPLRGYEDNDELLFHSPIVTPPHQFLAVYAWLETVYGSHAQIHVGTHARFEWTPGKQAALAEYDYPDITIGNVPSPYIYIVDNIAEGQQAKRRGLSVLINHLTPSIKLTELYSELIGIRNLVEQYEKSDPATETEKMQLIVSQIREKVKELNLDTDMEIDLDNISDDDLVHETDHYITELQGTFMPYGLRTFGEKWTDEEIALMLFSMSSVDTTDLKSLQRLIASSHGLDINLVSSTKKEELNNQAIEICRQIMAGKSPEELAAQLTSDPELTNELVKTLQNTQKNYEKLLLSFDNEMNSLMRLLSGGFNLPGPGGDPIRNPSVLPTGRNTYSFDAAMLPTPAAYILGSRLASDALSQLSPIPEKIAAVLWAVETARDDGAMISFILNMMGVKVTHFTDGRRNQLVAIPLEELGRPRVDVVVTTSGLFRDLYGIMITDVLDRATRVALATSYNTIVNQHPELTTALDSAVKTIADANILVKGNDPLNMNYIAKHWVELTLKYISQGTSAENAGEMAIIRTFTQPVGTYSTRVFEASEQSYSWSDRMQIADLYLERMKYSYSELEWGYSNPNLFRDLLTGVTNIYHSRSTNLYATLDNDDVLQYLGGLSLAIERLTGETPDAHILFYANPLDPRVESLQRFMTREQRTRYFNPDWIQGMMKEGYSGARTISQVVSHLWGWEVTTPHLIQDWMWDEFVDVYLNDKYGIGVTEWLSSNNQVYPMISLTGTLLNAAYKVDEGTGKPYWQTDEGTISQLANNWATLVAKHGVTCDHHICGDVELVDWAMQYVESDMIEQFKEQIYKATQNSRFEPSGSDLPGDSGETPGTTPGNPGTSPGSTPNTPSTPSSTPTSSHSHEVSSEAQDSSSESAEAGEEGAKSYEVSKTESDSTSQDNSMIYTIIGIISVLALVGAGFYFGPGRRS